MGQLLPILTLVILIFWPQKCNGLSIDTDLLLCVTVPASLAMAVFLLLFCIAWRITTNKIPAHALPDVFENLDLSEKDSPHEEKKGESRRANPRRMGFKNIIARQQAEKEEKEKKLRMARLAMEHMDDDTAMAPPKPYYPAV